MSTHANASQQAKDSQKDENSQTTDKTPDRFTVSDLFNEWKKGAKKAIEWHPVLGPAGRVLRDNLPVVTDFLEITTPEDHAEKLKGLDQAADKVKNEINTGFTAPNKPIKLAHAAAKIAFTPPATPINTQNDDSRASNKNTYPGPVTPFIQALNSQQFKDACKSITSSKPTGQGSPTDLAFSPLKDPFTSAVAAISEITNNLPEGTAPYGYTTPKNFNSDPLSATDPQYVASSTTLAPILNQAQNIAASGLGNISAILNFISQNSAETINSQTEDITSLIKKLLPSYRTNLAKIFETSPSANDIAKAIAKAATSNKGEVATKIVLAAYHANLKATSEISKRFEDYLNTPTPPTTQEGVDTIAQMEARVLRSLVALISEIGMTRGSFASILASSLPDNEVTKKLQQNQSNWAAIYKRYAHSLNAYLQSNGGELVASTLQPIPNPSQTSPTPPSS